MSAGVAEAVWLALLAYFGVGAALGLGAIVFGMKRLVPGAAVPVRVRLLVLPGMAALWPVIAARLMGVGAPEDRT